MINHFRQLFDYEQWANRRLLNAIEQLPAPDERALQLFAHLLQAQAIWLHRLKGHSPTQDVWESYDLPTCQRLLEQSIADWAVYMDEINEHQLQHVVDYHTTKGDPYSNQIKDILTHILNHSTYHRGQMVAHLKGKVPTLPNTDYIFYLRR